MNDEVGADKKEKNKNANTAIKRVSKRVLEIFAHFEYNPKFVFHLICFTRIAFFCFNVSRYIVTLLFLLLLFLPLANTFPQKKSL